jgi:hypothetical protein
VILEVWAVTDGEVLKGEDIIKCKSAGCETGWVSVKITSEMTRSTTSNVLDWSMVLAVGYVRHARASEASANSQRRSGNWRRVLSAISVLGSFLTRELVPSPGSFEKKNRPDTLNFFFEPPLCSGSWII